MNRADLSTSTMDRDRRLVLAQSYQLVFESLDGRAVLADLEAKFGCNPHTPGDPYQTAHNCGCLRVLQEIGMQIRYADDPTQ